MAKHDLKITTFNVENLFNRYALLDTPWDEREYEKIVAATGLASIADREGRLVSYQTTLIQRSNTAQAILDVAPDILATEEVENLYTLRTFNHQFLDDYFDRMLLIDGNDPRGIDVGILLKKGLDAEILAVRTHVDDAQPEKSVVRSFNSAIGYQVRNAIFSRDCLEVDVKFNNKVLTLLVNHFKAQDGKESSAQRRAAQAERVLDLAEAAHKAGKSPIVMGDLNADPTKGRDFDKKSLNVLLKKGANQPLVDHFPADTWTHYYTSGKEVSRLDYILTGKDLDVKSTQVWRKGLTTKCKQSNEPRYATIGPEHTEASDHCPTSVVLSI